MAIQPVHLHEKGTKVAVLHKGLLSLIKNQSGISDHDREILQGRLAPEAKDQTFGPVTAEVVGLWQNQLKTRPDLPPELKNKVKNLPVSPIAGKGNGDVDEVTAEALNWLVTNGG
jgi:hypothetical protein